MFFALAVRTSTVRHAGTVGPPIDSITYACTRARRRKQLQTVPLGRHCLHVGTGTTLPQP